MVDAPETMQLREFEDIVKFPPRDRPVQFRTLTGARETGAFTRARDRCGCRIDFEECPLLKDEPPFLPATSPSPETLRPLSHTCFSDRLPGPVPGLSRY
jgi:hypothetical protein